MRNSTSARERQGQSPGAMIKNVNEIPSIRCIDYDAKTMTERSISVKELESLEVSLEVQVLVFNNFRNPDLLQMIKEKYKVHSLSIEDLAHFEQRSKYDSYENYELCILNKYTKSALDVHKKQISVLLTGKTVLVFLEGKEKEISVEFVFTRIREGKGRIRERDSGYAAYAILDSIIDSYMVLLEDFEEHLDRLDEMIAAGIQSNIAVQSLFAIKKEVLHLKKNTWPLREMVNGIIRDENSQFFKDERNKLFFRDLQDHVFRITESVDGLRDSAYSLVEMHTNFVGLRMNEIMKVLTVITTIFAPVMFLASVYGMNLDGIPELHIPHAYPIFWVVVLILSIVQFIYFRRKGWI